MRQSHPDPENDVRPMTTATTRTPVSSVQKTQRRSGRTRSALLDAARAELMASEGEAEMAAIAARAGVSIGLAYHHFGSKAGLIASVVEDFYARYTDTVNARYPEPSWAARERARTKAIVAFFLSEPFARTLLGPLGRSAEVVNAEAGCMAAMIDLGARNIAQGQAGGELDAEMDPVIAAAFVLGGVRQCLTAGLAGADQPDPDALGEATWRHVAHALGAIDEGETHGAG